MLWHDEIIRDLTYETQALKHKTSYNLRVTHRLFLWILILSVVVDYWSIYVQHISNCFFHIQCYHFSSSEHPILQQCICKDEKDTDTGGVQTGEPEELKGCGGGQ
jgi:hypothetical protein